MINNIPLQLTSGASAEIFSNHLSGSAIQGIMIKNTTDAAAEIKVDFIEIAENIDFEMLTVSIEPNDTLFIKHPLYIKASNTLRVTAITGDVNMIFSYLIDKGVSIS